MERTVVEIHPLTTKSGAVIPDRFLVGFSDGTTLKATISVITEHHLHTGRVLTDEDYDAACSDAVLTATKQRALRIIGMRPFSSQELYDRLVEKGEEPHNSAAAVAWLCELHLLDDAQYADTVARHYAEKGYGIARIKQELYRRKVPSALWETALEALPTSEDKLDRLLRSKLRSEHPDRKELKKAADALYRRGFSWEEIRAALARYQSERED